MNENSVIIKNGITREDMIYMNTPDKTENIQASYLMK